MPQVWDAETEALRRELTQLSPKELLALAQQEGVRTAGRAAADIVEALLKMDCEDDAAASVPKHAPGQLAHHRDQPPHSRHAGAHSSSAHKQQHQHMQQGHMDYSNTQNLSARAISKQQQQQYEAQRRSANSMPPPAAPAAGGAQQPVAGLQRRQHQQEQQSDYLHAQQLHRQQQQQHYQQQQQQQRGRHSDYEQELQHESSFTFAAAAAGVSPGSHAGRSSSSAQIPAGRRAHGDDGRGVPYQDQVYTDRPLLGAYAPPAAGAAVAEIHDLNSSTGRLSARRGSATPPHPSREAFKQQQNMVLETKMQQLEQSLQQLQRSPRITPPSHHHESLNAQHSAGRSSGGGSHGSGGGGGGSAAKTNRRLWSSPSASAGSQQSPAPAATAAAAGAGSAYIQPPLSPSSRRPASRSGAQGFGRSPEPFASAASSGGGSSSSRPRTVPAIASAVAAASATIRPMSSGGGAYSSRSSSNILAEHAAQRPAAAAAAVAERQRAPSPSPSPQPNARSLSMSPAPPKGTPRVGVMPCQKAMLKKAAQEAAKAAAAAVGGSAGGSKPGSAERPGSSSSRGGGGSGGGSSTRERAGANTNGAVERGAVSSSGGLMRSASGARGGTPEPPSHSSRAAAGAVTPTAFHRATGSKGTAALRPLSPGIWPPAGPSASPRVSAGRVSASTSRALTATGHAAGRVSASATGAVSAAVAAADREERRRVKGASVYSEETAGGLLGADRPRSSRTEPSIGAVKVSNSSGRASLSGGISASRSTRGGAVTPPRSSLAVRAASARGAASQSGSYSSSSSTPVHQRGQQRDQQQNLSMTGTGLAGRARQLLAGSPVLGRHAREGSVTAGAAGSFSSRQQQEQQQQGHVAAEKQSQLLHTPMRVKSAAAGAAAPSRAGTLTQQPAAAGGYSTPVASKTRSMASAAAAAVSAAVTPARQQVRAFGDALSAAYGDNAPPSAAAGRRKAPLAGTAAAAAAAAASDGPAVMIGGMMTPKGAVMGSARRVASSQARAAMAAAAAAAQDTAAMQDRGGSNNGAPPVPATPLHKGARRTVPSDAGGQDEVDKHLQALVERCLRIRNPGAHKLALQGPEPAKRWLQQHLIGPWKRAGAGTVTTSSSSSSGGGPCMASGYCSRALLLHGPSGSGKTELVHALAAEMGANLLYLPGGESLLKTYQQEGHRLLRALFTVICKGAVARRVAPCVVCFDDAHMNFPSSVSRMSDPGGAASVARMTVEIEVHLQQLSAMQASLEAAAAAAQPQVPHSVQKPTASSSGRATPGRSSKSSSGGGSGEGSALRPVWGFFGCKAKSKSKEQSPEEVVQKIKQQQGGYAKMAGPVVVVFVTHRPDALDGALLQQLPVQLQLELPAAEAREDLLMGWLMEREAAVNVQDVEWLARQTEGFSCQDLVQLCQQAARGPAEERSHRAICMADLEAALGAMPPTMQQQQQQQAQLQEKQQQYQAHQYQQQHYQAQHYHAPQLQYTGSNTPMRRHNTSR